jgi:hypothetical protein
MTSEASRGATIGCPESLLAPPSTPPIVSGTPSFSQIIYYITCHCTSSKVNTGRVQVVNHTQGQGQHELAKEHTPRHKSRHIKINRQTTL